MRGGRREKVAVMTREKQRESIKKKTKANEKRATSKTKEYEQGQGKIFSVLFFSTILLA